MLYTWKYFFDMKFEKHLEEVELVIGKVAHN